MEVTDLPSPATKIVETTWPSTEGDLFLDDLLSDSASVTRSTGSLMVLEPRDPFTFVLASSSCSSPYKISTVLFVPVLFLLWWEEDPRTTFAFALASRSLIPYNISVDSALPTCPDALTS